MTDVTRPPVVFVDSPKLARAAMDELFHEAYERGRPTAIDTEFEPRTHEIALMSYSWGRGIRRVVEGGLVLEFFGDWLADDQTKGVYQNFKADRETFAEIGIDVVPAFFADTMITGCLHDETLIDHGLKPQSLHFLKWYRKDYKQLFAYVPVGKSKPIVLTPKQVLYDLPPDALVQAVTSIHKGKAKVGPRTKEQWRQLMLEYSGDDAESTRALHGVHYRYLKEIGYWDTYLNVDRQFTLTLMECEDHGVLLDQPRLRQILRKQDMRIMRCEHAFRAVSGNPKLNLRSGPQMKKLLIEEWGWPVRDDLMTESGEASMDKEAMSWWADECGYDMAKVKLEFNNASTMRGTFLLGLLEGVSDDGRLRSDLNQLGAKASGRISSRKMVIEVEETKTLKNGTVRTTIRKKKVGANLQNIPARKEKDPDGIRRAFVAPKKGQVNAWGEIADEDHVLVVADESGFELLMIIHWSSHIVKNSPMLELMLKYGSPSAVHAFTAINVFGDAVHRCDADCLDKKTGAFKKHHRQGFVQKLGELKMDDWALVKSVFPDQYSTSKNANFGLGYLGTAMTLARLRGQDWRQQEVQDDNQRIVDDWYGLYWEVPEYQQHMITHGYNEGWVPTIAGRRGNVAARLEGRDQTGKVIADERKRKSMIAYGERCCTNIPAQGSAADIIKEAMNRIARNERLRELRAAQLFQVHDEIILECRRSVAEEVLAIQLDEMRQPYKDRMKFPLVVEGGFGTNWVEAKP